MQAKSQLWFQTAHKSSWRTGIHPSSCIRDWNQPPRFHSPYVRTPDSSSDSMCKRIELLIVIKVRRLCEFEENECECMNLIRVHTTSESSKRTKTREDEWVTRQRADVVQEWLCDTLLLLLSTVCVLNMCVLFTLIRVHTTSESSKSALIKAEGKEGKKVLVHVETSKTQRERARNKGREEKNTSMNEEGICVKIYRCVESIVHGTMYATAELLHPPPLRWRPSREGLH